MNEKNVNLNKGIALLAVAAMFLMAFIGWKMYSNKQISALKNEPGNIELATKQQKQPLKRDELKIGFITDVHCYAKQNKETSEWELNWRCANPMNAFVKKMNDEFNPDIVLEGGDLADGRDDRTFKTFLEIKELYDRIDAPCYHVLGNHEVDNFPRSQWLETMGYKKAYYSLDVDNYRIIVLDGNYKPLPNGESVGVEPGNKYYPGLIGKKQMEWLEDLLKRSEKFTKLVFVHQPPIDVSTIRDRGELMLNAKQVRDLFSKYKVKAVFSGHIEEFCSLHKDDVQYYVIQGFLKNNRRLKKVDRFKDAGVFSELTINDNIEVKVYYTDGEKNGSYKSMILNQETAVCNDSSVSFAKEQDEQKR
ncbi:MAG: metallophosphoesterase [Patescibacteria group bacterium]|nr:metallophosphoesterase [Patescibacteria group bacterium]